MSQFKLPPDQYPQALTLEQYNIMRESAETAPVSYSVEVAKPVPANIITDHKIPDDRSFMVRGNCNDLPPERMFGPSAPEIKAAKEICNNCVVKIPCLKYALENKIRYGVWGGASERERIKMQQALRSQGLANE